VPDLSEEVYAWELDQLPWDAVTPVSVGDAHPPTLDARLVDAITKRALPASLNSDEARVRPAAIAFLYLYMVLTHEDER